LILRSQQQQQQQQQQTKKTPPTTPNLLKLNLLCSFAFIFSFIPTLETTITAKTKTKTTKTIT
jgi:hypothetical protein